MTFAKTYHIANCGTVMVSEFGAQYVPPGGLVEAGLRHGRGQLCYHLYPRKRRELLEDFMRLAYLDAWLAADA